MPDIKFPCIATFVGQKDWGVKDKRRPLNIHLMTIRCNSWEKWHNNRINYRVEIGEPLILLKSIEFYRDHYRYLPLLALTSGLIPMRALKWRDKRVTNFFPVVYESQIEREWK